MTPELLSLLLFQENAFLIGDFIKFFALQTAWCWTSESSWCIEPGSYEVDSECRQRRTQRPNLHRQIQTFLCKLFTFVQVTNSETIKKNQANERS